MKLTLRVAVAYQRSALALSYWINRVIAGKKPKSFSWVVGPDEVATMLVQIANVIPNSYSVSFTEEDAYDVAYDHHFRTGHSRRWIERILVGPILLGRLMNQAKGFIYVGSTGFLLDELDYRDFEFAFLKKHALPIVCYWTGSDIRSTKLMHKMEEETGVPNISTYISAKGEIFESEEWDEQRRRIANVADKYADAMFNWATDQLGYLTSSFETFMYFLDEEESINAAKFKDLSRLVLVHATTSPVIKGTPLVRAAIDRLKADGYDFEYVELIGVPNARVIAELRRAHIALNQFYGFTPTIFGVEAMLQKCVVLMSANERMEPDLPPGSDESWMVTQHHEIYENLKMLLDNRGLLEPIGERGLVWARSHATAASAGKTLRQTLDAILRGTYERPRH